MFNTDIDETMAYAFPVVELIIIIAWVILG